MDDDHKIMAMLLFALASLAIMGTIFFWNYSMQQAVLDNKLSTQCVEQGGTPLIINGQMSCLHKIARIA